MEEGGINASSAVLRPSFCFHPGGVRGGFAVVVLSGKRPVCVLRRLRVCLRGGGGFFFARAQRVLLGARGLCRKKKSPSFGTRIKPNTPARRPDLEGHRQGTSPLGHTRRVPLLLLLLLLPLVVLPTASLPSSSTRKAR